MRHRSGCGEALCLYVMACLAMALVAGNIGAAPAEAEVSSGPHGGVVPAGTTSADQLYLPVSLRAHRDTLTEPIPTHTATRTDAPTATATPTPSAWVTVLHDDFEGPFPGVWEVTQRGANPGRYLWGARSCRAAEGLRSGWAVGGGADGEALACDAPYPVNVDSWMVYGPFSLADATEAELRFQLWLRSEAGFDEFFAGASLDGRTFYGLWASGDSQGWGERVLDLTQVPTLGDLAGRAQVWIALTFTSDDYFSDAGGAYVDDIVLRKRVSSARPASTPLPSRIEPHARVAVTEGKEDIPHPAYPCCSRIRSRD